jgi:nucleoside-diphosphate-sugar epimerase
MTHVLVTGAAGYVGRALSTALAQRLEHGAIRRLTLLDLTVEGLPSGPGIRLLPGDLSDPALRGAAIAPKVDQVFHLAGITSRAAQEQFDLGLRVNVRDSMALLDDLRQQQPAPRVVYASSIGVFGTPLPDAVDDTTEPAPTLSYGAQKRMMEILLADLNRRGMIDARCVRLPSVVARPSSGLSALSSFASDLIREPAEGRAYTCPIAADGTMWLLSLPACVQHLLQAADAPAHALPAQRVWNLPALRVTPADVVDGLCRRFGPSLAQRVRYVPDAGMQAQMAVWPPLQTTVADRLGMVHDGDIDTLITRALAP